MPETGQQTGPETVEVEPAHDLASLVIHLEANSRCGYMDIFLYSDGFSSDLEYHIRTSVDASTPICLPGVLTEGDKVLLVIANSPELNVSAFSKIETVEQMVYEYANENIDAPLMAGEGNFTVSGEETEVTVRLSPLLTPVTLEEVERDFDDSMKYVLLENPRVFLKNVNSSAEVFRTCGFRPVSLVDDTLSLCSKGLFYASLQHDVGFYAEHPGVTLYAYPNDAKEPTMGTPWTRLVLQCEIRGGTCSFEAPLGPLERGVAKWVSFSVRGPGDYSYSVR